MKVTISHEYQTDPKTFWDRVFFDEAYNKALYVEGLGFPEYALLEQSDKGDSIHRRVRVTPRQEAPAAVQKLLGGRFSYVEEGTFDRATQRYRFRVVPATLADKIRAEGELRAEPAGEGRMRRVLEMTVEVKVFGIGGIAEGFVSKSMQDSYAQAAAFTNKWLAQQRG